jgi:ATP-dependent DNA helicase RecQ
MSRRTTESRKNRSVSLSGLEKRAREVFGIQELRPGQRDVLAAVIRERNVLAIMPSGAGKSLCYQLSALALPGTAVVVSPLLALMKDQSDKLKALGFGAPKINGVLRKSKRVASLESIRHQETEFVFTTPEQLEDPVFISALRQGSVSLLVIDEAHCISEWGHDFRPSYSMLGGAIRALGNPPLLALTATATPQVIEDIKRQLGIDSLKIINTGVYRPNLRYEVIPRTNAEQKQATVYELIRLDGAGLIYCATIKNVETLFAKIRACGLNSLAKYHGRLRSAERASVQDRFMSGDLQTVIATNAFGMGIDRPDIRFVIHFDVPASIEAYYQESGRAGRDGELARCLLLYRLEDRRTQDFFLAGGYPNTESIDQVCKAIQRLQDNAVPVTSKAVQQDTGLGRERVGIVLSMLKESGLIRQERVSRFRWISPGNGRDKIHEMVQQHQCRRELEREKLEKMMLYGQIASCRWKYLLDYFGERLDWSKCGNCDNCLTSPESWVGNERQPV